MQQQRREEVAKFIQTSIFSINEIASMCGVTLKTAYNVKQRILAGESIEHKGGAGPKKRLNKGDRISLFLAMKNNPPTSLPLCKTVSRLHEELMFHIRQWGDVWKGCRIPRKPPSKEQILLLPLKIFELFGPRNRSSSIGTRYFLQMSVPSGFVKEKYRCGPREARGP